jgi:hypothetical protein
MHSVVLFGGGLKIRAPSAAISEPMARDRGRPGLTWIKAA